MYRHGFFSLVLMVFCAVAYPRNWTVLVYVGGDEEELEKPTRLALEKIEWQASQLNADNVRFVVFLDRPGDDTLTPAPSYPHLAMFPNRGEPDSGHPVTLKKFLKWAVRHFQADNYMLFLLGHSWGIQGIMQDFFVNRATLKKASMMKIYEIRRALQEVYLEESRNIPKEKFDVLVVDACVAGQIEVAHELDVVRYFVASTLETPNYGMPYEKFLPYLRDFDSAAPPVDPWLENVFLPNVVTQSVATYSALDPTPPQNEQMRLEGGMDPVQMVALRTSQIPTLVRDMARWTATLPKDTWRWFLHESSGQKLWKIADTDQHADLWMLADSMSKALHGVATTHQRSDFLHASIMASQVRNTLRTRYDDPTQ
jgi:hypothetical protein